MKKAGNRGSEPADEERRRENLLQQFRRSYGRDAQFVTRAPGRVNLLGEHTDYNGLPVLPMAIDRNTLIAGAARRDLQVNVKNLDSSFAPRSFELAKSIPAFAAGDWGNYTKAAAQGLALHAGKTLRHGADLLVDGNIPHGAGLSSSSALVVATALALLAANERHESPETLAEILPGAERYVGTLSGGMDHAISLLAEAGHALRIDFFPLRTRPVPLPSGYDIIVCHSLVQAEKSAAAKRHYNHRVIECRLACRLLDVALGTGLPRDLTMLGDLATLFPGRSLSEFVAYLSPWLPDRPLSLAEIATYIGAPVDALQVQCQVPPGLSDAFAVVRRARHVLTEAERVGQAEEALGAGDAGAFASLMDASHASCRDDYEISCREIEDLIRASKDGGALGARLTGAGFGGCTVSLVDRSRTAEFLKHVDRHFYAQRLADERHIEQYRFVFRPRGGATSQRLEAITS
ncbi:MAG TPA: galactokinase [Candidatus Acidoferrales bacterium]|nr:galactokinase [Candidatus Acidoferrales bacterium]